jgi:PAS domain S-box-containing protein
MRSYACAVYGENGEVVRIYVATQDITERRQAEEALKESEARYRTISQLIADYAYAVRITPDKRRILEWITAAFSRITGFTAHDLTTDEGLALLIHPEDMPYIQQRLDALFSGEASTGEYRIITKSGEVRWLQEYSSPEWDSAQSRVVRIIGAGRDITERKRLEALLQEQIIRPKDLGTNLRRFRQQLGMTQITFGQAFGGYSQRQITSYETGDIEIPMGLLLAIRDKGYPLEAVLGTGPTGTLDQVVGRLSHSWKTHETARRLVESILRLLDRESATISTILQTLSVPPPEDDIRDYHTLREMLRRTGIELPVAPSQGKTT